MATNLIEEVQVAMAYPTLQKIDPNTDVVKEDNHTPDEHTFSQAAIPAILTGMYKYVQTEQGATDYMLLSSRTNWMEVLYANHRKDAIQAIASYAKQSSEDPLTKMNAIANKACEIVQHHVGNTATVQELQQYFKAQKNDILLYLPTALNIGELLNDAMLDDTVNKMEGPISSLVQSIGNAFASPIKPNE